MNASAVLDRAGASPAPGLGVAAVLAVAAPPLLAYNQAPSATALNQCLAVFGWGVFMIALRPAGAAMQGRALLAALALAMLGVAASWGLGTLPLSLGLSALGLLAGAMVVAWGGVAAASSAGAERVFTAFATALAVAGVLSALVAVVQVFAPAWADGDLIAQSALAGRAIGNLRQPNHLCSLLVLALIAVVALLEMGRLGLRRAAALVLLLVLGMELSASRTGAAGLVLLLLWGLLDSRLSRGARVLLAATPAIYAAAYAAMLVWGRLHDQVIGAGARLAAEAQVADSPNSRWHIWGNALELIGQQPWTGVGFGEFNLAWSLTPFPGRPTAFFDHTHSLPLQLAVELGLPLAGAVLALLLLALLQGLRRSREVQGSLGVAARSAWMLVAMMALHSLVEYPLWYAYFLLPTAFAWGFVLGLPGARGLKRVGTAALRDSSVGWLMGGVLAAAGLSAALDYQRVVVIFTPGEGRGSVVTRIERGQRSVFFAHHADYAAATNKLPEPIKALGIARSPHLLLDTRLMLAWANHLAETGQVDRARWLAQRLREFRNPESKTFFESCREPGSEAFQCQPPREVHGWREFAAGR
ncbi:MAG: O-antigen ligase C-terminal domain-containing protein [Burkholderiaceae bacterium]|nr:O-antigen ligase C-terminal domain-containing protein [Burkholderiaceae bacterium]